jgi:N-acetylmuramoyl-L-alanine amidase
MHISILSSQGVALKNTVGLGGSSRVATAPSVKKAVSRRRARRLDKALISSHVAVMLVIIGVVFLGYRAPVEATTAQVSSSILEQQNTTVDQIAAANVASSVAHTLDLSVDNNVQNLAASLNVKTELAQTDATFISKPQIVQQDSGRKGILSYASKDGDTVQSVAAAFGVSEDTIRWANNLTSDAIGGGKNLKIPGTTGAVYTVKAGDAVEQLADKYKSDKDRIITFNNLELSGLQPGSQIVLPGGVLPENERPGYVAPAARTYASSSYSSYTVSSSRVGSYEGNGYAYGYCTWYAYNRRAELGRPIGGNWGNAATWAAYARADGFAVDKNPRPGDVFQQGGGWSGLGHVGVVESVNDDGSINVSEMNYAGWNRISSRTIGAGQVSSYNYIH